MSGSGIYRMEYSLDGGERHQAILLESGTYRLPVLYTRHGYVVVDFWIYDYALNVYHDTLWYWIEAGHIKSIQPVADFRYRVNILPERTSFNKDPIKTYRVNPVPHPLTMKVELIPNIYIVRKYIDQVVE